MEKLNEIGWKAEKATILNWRDTEGRPTDGQAAAGEIGIVIHEATEYNTESLAKFAFSMLYRAALFSKENNVPILLDY
ncbi:hypothetical protein NLX71_00245 [Paenibacillus sp. MZ04-78.2]|uniref:hypothetical protein n=1 Tax=Paenibacillus sp. MZ04-78.2 TaxID=2962034 RepID=UPI0020B8CAD5|nr:hypothetical protein [Paenibacillus sp. MZ04-78.2]MCP3771751.1 hypothetical protein [Paenibacillus sp. MZ04-78.2]